MTLMCPACRRALPEEIIEEIVAAADYHKSRAENMLVGLECPCGRRVTFALDTTTLEPIALPPGLEQVN